MQQPVTPTRRLGLLFNSLIVMVGYLLSRALGLARDVVINARFGTTPAADAYQAAFYVPDLLYLVIIGGALGSAFIPIFSQLLTSEGEERAWLLASQVMTLAVITLAGVSLLVAILARPLVGALYPGFDPATLELTTRLTRLLLLSPLLLGLGGLAMATLNALDPAVYNLSIIISTLLLSRTWGIAGVAVGVVVGALLYLLIQLPPLLRAGLRWRPALGLRDAAVRRVGWLMAPRVFGQSAMQINLIVMASIASTLGDGPVRALGQAYQLMLLPHGIFALSLGTVSFPAMSRAWAAGQRSEVIGSMRELLRFILWMVVPAAVALAVLRVPLVRLLFERGMFDDRSTALVAQALLLYATALPAFAASEILIRTFYAMQETRLPVVAGLVTVGLNIGLSLLLVKGLGLGHVALAGAFSLTNNLEALLLVWLLRRRLGALDPGGELRRSLRHTVVASLGLLGLLGGLLGASQAWLPWLGLAGGPRAAAAGLPLLAWLVVVAVAGMACYLGLSALQGAQELRRLGDRLGRRLRRGRPA